jgi:hypothetical protein
MRRIAVLTVAILCAGGAFQAVAAQKSAPLVTRDTDHDGVPDTRDRCRGTAAGTRVDPTGCPAPAAAAPSPQPATPVAAPQQAATPTAQPAATAPTQTASAPTNPPATTPANPQPSTPTQGSTPASGRPSGLPTPSVPVVTPGTTVSTQAANPPAANPSARPPVTTPVAPPPPPAPPVTDPTMTAGFWMPLYTGTTDAAQLDYARSLVLKLDSAIVSLVEIFRNINGVPLPGASSPNLLSAREKSRWTRCRFHHLDLTTIGEAVEMMKDSMAGGPTVARGIATLAEAFTDMTAIQHCDELGSMIESPDRWAPWQQNYESSARDFYKDWYPQLRNVHEANRGFARSLLTALPAGRQFPVPAGLPRTAPTIGAVR